MPLLTKTAFMAGRQCLLRLWFEQHEPRVEEGGPALKSRLRWGQRIGAMARAQFPGGDSVRLVGGNAVPVTRELLARGGPALFEAAFEADRAFAAIDILVRDATGLRAIEVKMQSGRKAPTEELIDEVAFESMVMHDAGTDVQRLDVMRLNPDARFPDLHNLFDIVEVTTAATARVSAVRELVARMLPVLDGARPDLVAGAHCKKPDPCPFFDRCNPEVAPNDVRKLYRLHYTRRDALAAVGITMMEELPNDFKLTPIQARQVRAMRTGTRVVEPALAPLLAAMAFPIAFLDFETVNLPVPRFDGMGPWQQVPVQLSCHVLGRDGSVVHHEWLAPSSGDPRPAFADATLDAVAGASTVVAHHASFEAERLRETAQAVPARAAELEKLAASLQDTEVWINEHVYDIAFNASFSLKKILPALLGSGYEDLAVQDGLTASALLEQLIWEHDWLEQDPALLRDDLLAYCKRDTEALVALWHELNRLATETLQ